ncbi:MAG: hypothetical protein D6753_05730 [Planctomycetota bacterium]|nr:MAG: hypothetical protein D6753_05730 [Planctomycetota bacterium]
MNHSLQRIQLLGLILIITTLLLAVVAFGTGTTRIRMRQPSDLLADLRAVPSAADAAATDPTTDPLPEVRPEVRFVYVHVAYPLAAIGLVAMLLWSVPGWIAAPFQRRKTRSARRRR